MPTVLHRIARRAQFVWVTAVLVGIAMNGIVNYKQQKMNEWSVRDREQMHLQLETLKKEVWRLEVERVKDHLRRGAPVEAGPFLKNAWGPEWNTPEKP